MAFTFRNGEHHKNPSGCHNKVKWILSQCKWDIKNLEFFVDKFVRLELLNREVPVPRLKDKYKPDWLYGWLDAVNIALYIADENNRERLSYYAYEKYPWISKYREFVPYNEWEKQRDESREAKKTN